MLERVDDAKRLIWIATRCWSGKGKIMVIKRDETVDDEGWRGSEKIEGEVLVAVWFWDDQ